VASRLEPGTLYVVATPIGNLADVTQRALEVLGSADLLFAEDTRTTRRFMAHHGLAVRLVSAHAHNEPQRARELVRRLGAGEAIAVVTDAGSPGLSDPGGRLGAPAAVAGFPIVAVPGPSALVAALSVSGLPADRFTFAGFLPARAGARRRRLAELVARGETLVFFEAPHRVRATLALLAELCPRAQVAACREMTKRFEEVLRGTPEEIAARLTAERERGEWTFVVDPAREAQAPETPPARPRAVRPRGTPGRRGGPRLDPVDAWVREQMRQGASLEEARARASFVFGKHARLPRRERGGTRR
jgi:16S rRNA (cytidine1402-2'-O)-methyltransferase